MAELCTFSFPKTSLKNLNRLNDDYQKQIGESSSNRTISSIVSDSTFYQYCQRIIVGHIERVEKEQQLQRNVI